MVRCSNPFRLRCRMYISSFAVPLFEAHSKVVVSIVRDSVDAYVYVIICMLQLIICMFLWFLQVVDNVNDIMPVSKSWLNNFA